MQKSKNETIREILAATCQQQSSHNTFEYGKAQIKIDFDRPGFYTERSQPLKLSIYDSQTNRELVVFVSVSKVVINEDAL